MGHIFARPRLTFSFLATPKPAEMNFSLQTTHRNVDVLLVEDNSGDIRLAHEAHKNATMLVSLHVVGDGEQAANFLDQSGIHALAPRPRLILLDLILPKRSGLGRLRYIKEDPKLCIIPVVILKTASLETDMSTSYQLHGNSYVVTSLEFEDYGRVIQCINRCWVAIVRLPPCGASG